MHLWTLYKEKAAGESLNHSEYYQLQIETVLVNDVPHYAVKENHGWWREGDFAVHPTATFAPVVPYATHEEAEARIEMQIWHRAEQGFVHLFEPSPFADQQHRYRELNPADKSRL